MLSRRPRKCLYAIPASHIKPLAKYITVLTSEFTIEKLQVQLLDVLLLCGTIIMAELSTVHTCAFATYSSN